MRILYSSVIEQHAGWGAEWFLNQGFLRLGHATTCIDYRQNRQMLHTRFLLAPSADVFLLQRGDRFPLSILCSLGIPSFFYSSELFSRCRDHDHILASGIPEHVFMRTQACINAATDRGWLRPYRASVLLSAFDERTHRPIANLSKDIDILHIGAMTQRRGTILDQLSSRYDVTSTTGFGEEFVRVVNRAKIVLNIHSENYLDTETRVFEVLGCGSFLLTEQLSPENPFSNTELGQFSGTSDLIDKVGFYLTHEKEREEIAYNGHSAALRSHTYTHRATQIANVMLPYARMTASTNTKNIARMAHLFPHAVKEQIQRATQSGKRRFGRYFSVAVRLVSQPRRRR